MSHNQESRCSIAVDLGGAGGEGGWEGTGREKSKEKNRKASLFLFTKYSQSIYASCPLTITMNLKLKWLPSNFIPGYLFEVHKKPCMGMPVANLFIITPNWNQLRGLSAGQTVVHSCNGTNEQ